MRPVTYAKSSVWSKYFCMQCCSNEIMSGVNGNVIMSGCRDDDSGDLHLARAGPQQNAAQQSGVISRNLS